MPSPIHQASHPTCTEAGHPAATCKDRRNAGRQACSGLGPRYTCYRRSHWAGRPAQLQQPDFFFSSLDSWVTTMRVPSEGPGPLSSEASAFLLTMW